MISPDLATVEGLAGQYSIVPICREIYADTFTPITVLRTLSGMGKNYFLLESAEVGEKWGRYSFLGFDPVMRICCKENTVTIESQGQRTSISSQNPLEVLRQIHREYRAPRINSLPPFTGGFVGYFGYAMIAYAEPKLTIKRGSFNDFDLLLCDKVIVYDHFRHKLLVVANVKTDRVKENYAEGVDKIEFLTSLIRKSPSLPPVEKETSVRFTPATSKDEYCHMVKKAKEYIRAGDIFQVVLSRQFTAPFPYSLFNSYRVLDLQKEWQQLTGQETARIPQAGFVVVNSSQLDKGVVEKFQQNLTDAVKWINDNPEEAGSLVEKHFDWMKAPAVQQSLQFARLELVPAADCQKEIEAFYTELSKTAPAEALGGKLPDAGFYFQP
jgi:hypothetical protein